MRAAPTGKPSVRFGRRAAAWLLVFAAIAAPLLPGPPALAGERLRMSTTTSTENSGLLGALLPPFEKRYGCKVDVIAVGTGKALKLGEAGDVDLVFVHARKLEDKFVADGFGVDRRDVMYNDFVLIGPAADPAEVRKTGSAVEALRRIAATRSVFVSRGDESGTHHKERELWRAAGVVPKGKWYLETGQGMGEVIYMAAQLRAYALADRGTYLAYRKKTDLAILHEGDEELWNPYGVMAVNPAKHPHVKYGLAMKFIDFITREEGQAIIASYKVDGKPLFFTYAPKGR
ncbi:MAG: substrate-binding domain-containing protein [Deltaproteobacteria bacterium]|nr:substrate-binding domain-containing protein [Deltaproteobacteria bacterium]